MKPNTLTRCLVLALSLAHGSANVAAGAEPLPRALEVPTLHNVFQVTPRVFSGSSPEDEAGFAALQKLGVRTIVSVDGARPAVELARRFGFQYIHVPIGYDGVPATRWPELIAAAGATNGALYVHCHHGKHRGPAAAAVLCLGTAGWSTNAAVAWMKQAGTSPEYAGLYRSVVEFTPPDPTRLPPIRSLPEVARTTTVVEAMVRLDQHLEMLKLGQKASWQSIPQHPDLSVAQESVLLLEQLRELARHPDSTSRETEYRRLMTESITAAESLVALLRESVPAPSAADQGLQRLNKTCSACHQPYRN